MRQFIGEDDVVRQLPFGDARREKGAHIFTGQRGAGFADHDQQRTLLPFGMGNADDSGFLHARMRERSVLEINRADPLASGLDHVLGSIGKLNEAVGMDLRDISRREPSFRVTRLGALRPVIARRDPGTARQQMAGG